jgi:acetaldehyde dehydrogenase (acetylating)
MDKDLQSIQDARRLVGAAHAAWKTFEHFTAERVEAVLEAVSAAAAANAARLAEMAVRETGFGNVADKTAKNLFGAREVLRAMRPLKTIGIIREDLENRVWEVATPVGVIAGVVPSTNPTSTTICKALIALKGRNAIVFSPHPSAAESIGATTRVISGAAEAAGAPPGIVSAMSMPTLEGTNELMRDPKVALILATGGPGLVRAAYSSGKPAFGVGPGNVPAYIEKTADVVKAVRDILTGKCFDHGTLCSSEQAVIADRAIADTVVSQLQANGAYLCRGEERRRLEAVIGNPRGGLNTAIVGKAAVRIAEMAGIDVPSGTRALVAEADGVGPEHPLSMEKLSPVLAFYRVDDWKEGCRLSIRILEFGGLGHTLGLHTADDAVVRAFALEKPASRICVNTPAALGAVGLTTNLFPSMTLGCGAFGNNITSDNISPLHLVNVKRVAWGVREVEAQPDAGNAARSREETAASAAGATPRADPRHGHIAALVEDWVDRHRGPAGASDYPAGGYPAGKDRAATYPDGCGPVPASAPGVEAPAVGPTKAPAPAGPSSLPGTREESGLPRPTAPRLTAYARIEPGEAAGTGEPPENRAAAGAAPRVAVAFVCEDDVRAASRTQTSIPVDARTIITPSARELGEELDVFVKIG